MIDDIKKALTDVARSIYLALPESVADDISRKARAGVERIKKLEKELECKQADIESLLTYSELREKRLSDCKLDIKHHKQMIVNHEIQQKNDERYLDEKMDELAESIPKNEVDKIIDIMGSWGRGYAETQQEQKHITVIRCKALVSRLIAKNKE